MTNPLENSMAMPSSKNSVNRKDKLYRIGKHLRSFNMHGYDLQNNFEKFVKQS